MKVCDLLYCPSRHYPRINSHDRHPFRDGKALWDAEILEIHFDTLASVLGIVMKLYTLTYPEYSTGVLIARNIVNIAWDGQYRKGSMYLTGIDSHKLERDNSVIKATIYMINDRLTLAASEMTFYAGNTDGILDVSPDYEEVPHRLAMHGQVPGWDSDIKDIHCLTIGSLPPTWWDRYKGPVWMPTEEE